jgi:hypothetical protein
MESNLPQLGDPVPRGITVYRAFSKKTFRERRADGSGKVRSGAYYREPNHEDGLSLGMTPEAAVSGLTDNFGYCSISVDAIRSLPYKLEVRPYITEPSHLVLCNLPFFIAEDDERGLASEIASSLAKKSSVVTCDHYPPMAQGPPPSAV